MSTDLLEIASLPGTCVAEHVKLRATAYGGREQTLAQLHTLIRSCRGYLLHIDDLSSTAAGEWTLAFEVPRHTVFELYSGLLAADLDLSRDSHLRLTGLCTLRRYHPLRGGNVSLRLELAFLDAGGPDVLWPSTGLA